MVARVSSRRARSTLTVVVSRGCWSPAARLHAANTSAIVASVNQQWDYRARGRATNPRPPTMYHARDGSMCSRTHGTSYALFVWLISHQPTVLFSQNKPAASNQPAVLFSQNKSAPAISHQPNEQAASFEPLLTRQ
jgi:hypothetical protein